MKAWRARFLSKHMISAAREILTKIINFSARNFAGSGGESLIAGFSLSKGPWKRVLVRAIEPSLKAFGVNNYLDDPALTVFDSAGNRVAFNDNWEASLAVEFSKVGAFTLVNGSKDAAVQLILKSDASYTVQVSSKSEEVGEALIEIYVIP